MNMRRVMVVILVALVAGGQLQAMECDTLKEAKGYVLIDAAKKGNLDKVRELLDEGVDINFQRPDRGYPVYTALYSAVALEKHDVAALLLERGAKIDISGALYSEMHQAAFNADIKMIELLLNKGGNGLTVRRNFNGETPLQWAQKKHVEIGPNTQVHRFSLQDSETRREAVYKRLRDAERSYLEECRRRTDLSEDKQPKN